MIDLALTRNVALIVDLAVMLWFLRLRWYGLFSVTVACIAASMIVG